VGAKLILRVVLVLVAAALVAGAGYLKFRSLRKIRIKNAVVEKLKAAPSETLRGSDLRVWVSDDREVTLDGAVRGAEDFTLAGRLPARCRAWLTCVIDLSWCRRRRQIRSSQRGHVSRCGRLFLGDRLLP